MNGITKSTIITGTKGVKARVTVSQTYDIPTNTSALSVAVELSCADYYGYTYFLDGSVAAAGKTLQTMTVAAGSHYVNMQSLNTYYPVTAASDSVTGSPWQVTDILHNTDGSKTVTVALDLRGVELSGRGASGWTVTGSASVTLTQIPRASTVGCSDGAIGSAVTVTVDRKSSSYTHSVAYRFGDLSGYLTASGDHSDTEQQLTAAAISFHLPESFYHQIPNAPTGECTLTCRTYQGSTLIGREQSCSFTVTALESRCGPTVTGSVTDTNAATVALTGNPSLLVRYASHACCTLTATAQKGATVSQKTVNGHSLEGDTVTFPQTETDLFTFLATDSRGYSANYAIKTWQVDYVLLTCNPQAGRDDPTSGRATVRLSGEYYNGSFGAADNTLQLRCRVEDGDWMTLTPVLLGNTYTATAALTGLDYTRQFTLTVEATDRLTTVTRQTVVKKGIPVFHWGESDFTFCVPVTLEGGLRPQCVTDLDAVTAAGFYSWTAGAAGAPFSAGSLLVLDRETGTTQLAVEPGLSGSGQIAVRHCTDSWQSWEYVNPPMAEGVEYRTVYRHQGKPVYTKAVRCAELQNNGRVNTAHGIADLGQVLDARGYAAKLGGGFGYPIPLISTVASLGQIGVYVNSNIVQITTTADWSGYDAVVTVRYTKTSD